MKFALVIRQIFLLMCLLISASCVFTQVGQPPLKSEAAKTSAFAENGTVLPSTLPNLSAQKSTPEEISRLEEAIAKEYEAYRNKRPRIEFVSGRNAGRRQKYVDDCINRIIKSPQNVLSLLKSGVERSLQITISINQSGAIEEIKLNRSSGKKTIDEAAREVIRQAAPFAEFPDEMRQAVDILSVTQSFGLKD
jgi:periplasmic protein TonB